MSGQTIAVIVLVALAALYVLRAFRLSVRGGSCGSGCGKCSKPAAEEIRPGTISLKQIDRP